MDIMNDFVVKYMAHEGFLTGNDFMELTNTCKSFRVYNKDEFIRKLWKHGPVKNLRTACYVEKLLKKYPPGEILGETTNVELEREVVSALRRMLTSTKMKRLSKTHASLTPSLFAREKISILGKRFR